MARVRAILFDAVGTLMFPNPPVVEVYHRVGRRYGSQLTRDQVAARFARAFECHYQRAHGAACDERLRWQRVVEATFDDVPSRAIFAELWRHFASPRHWSLFEDVAPTWAWLRQRGYRLGIASNFDERLSALCAALAPLQQAELVVHSSALGVRKPQYEFFTRAAWRLQLPPAAIMMIGDDWRTDYQGARAAGWTAVLLDRHTRQSGPDRIKSLHDVRRLLQRLASSHDMTASSE